MDDFDTWVAEVFGDGETAGAWTADPVTGSERLRHLFGHAGEILAAYSDDQVGRGIRALWEEDLHGLSDRRVAVQLRTGTLRAIVTLYREIFAARIVVEDHEHPSRLEHACFMFFDAAPLDLGDDTVLDVLEEILAIDSAACQRAALHGLGHAYFHVPQHVPPIVDRWLKRHRDAPEELRAYAADARIGRVN
ncbi:MAG: hypothetical protein HOV66_23315 [Streptomycetaceae bacterium]|nr:hypothetical protein [Streptomycetaceae bacterium]